MKILASILFLALALTGYAAAPSLVYNPYTTNTTTAADARVVLKTNGVADVRGSQTFTMQTTGGNYKWSTTSGELRLTNLVNLTWYEWNDPFRMGSISDTGTAHWTASPSTGDMGWDGTATGNGAGITNVAASTLASRGKYATNSANGIVLNVNDDSQLFVTNATFTVSGFQNIASRSQYKISITVSNSSASSITANGPPTCFYFGAVSTNAVVIAAGKEAIFSYWVRANRTNSVNCVQQ